MFSFFFLLQFSELASASHGDGYVLQSDDEQSDAPTDLSNYLEPECIIGSTDRKGELMFLVKW